MNFFSKLFINMHKSLYRLSNGSFLGQFGPMKILLLTTIGRKSGKARTIPLGYMADGDNYVVVASNGGSDKHPAWWLNLENQPEATIQVKDQKLSVIARRSEGVEYKRLFTQLNEMNSSYGDYQAKTSRKIPVVILEPQSDSV